MTGTPRTVLGILHPGSMGAAVAAQAVAAGAEVLWCSSGRSAASRARAEEAGLTPVGSLAELVNRCDIILSLCPPAHAEAVAAEVGALAFAGIFIEGNAISPARAVNIAAAMPTAQAVVDGAVIGSPPVRGKRTRLYLSGPADGVSAGTRVFHSTGVDTYGVEGGVGKASALKMAYTTYQKTSRVLAALAWGLADTHGVGDHLQDIAALRTANYLSEVDYIPKTAARAWRWAPEMREAVTSLAEAGLPTELTEAAALVIERWESDKDRAMSVQEALSHLRSGQRE